MKRTANAEWKGDLKSGTGVINTQSNVLKDTQYSFKTRFESGIGTNPEELLAAAHAGCFTMAVSANFTSKGIVASRLHTEAILDLDMQNLVVTGIHLKIEGEVPGITAEEFEAVVKDAEKNCIISKALSVPITSEALFIA